MCNHRALPTLLLFAALLLTACGGDAVVYAPTALPPDLSPQVWAHPSGAFSVAVPRHWAVYVQNDATLASASFSPPGAPAPVLTVAAIRVGAALDDTALGTLAAEIQSTHRPDQRRYTQTAVERTPDGAWRFSGARLNPDGSQTPLNTFISTAGGLVALADAAVPTDPALLADVQRAVNTITLNADSPLPPAEPAAFGFIRVAALEAQNTAAWTNSSGVGNTVIEANDFTMGYHLPAGGFAPFSLRFGQGQPAEALGYRVTVGDGALFPPPRPVMGAPALAWTDSSTFSPDGSLSIMGTVTHTGEGATARDLLGVITVFDSTGDVIGAWFTPLGIASLAAGESADYAVRVPELGGGARNYIIDVQGYGG
ncbi:MAG: hypothetical protein MUF38_03495 [Anaerolineae bacterium]|nr:hypothetical protein [Anaerolineae bacterium]